MILPSIAINAEGIRACEKKGLGFDLTQVKHSVKEYVHDQAHTNGMESFGALLKRRVCGDASCYESVTFRAIRD